MLSQFHALEQATADRYANDLELEFLATVGQEFTDRRALYERFEAIEDQLVEETYQLLQQKYPDVLQVKGMDLSGAEKSSK
ncbi:MAG: hypothetical protein VKJ85_07250 [Prochlorothrix sp.]|nr:hypothetical protein [Prochlorothrix sp.]